MNKNISGIIFLFLSSFISITAFGQIIDSASFSLRSRLSFYSYESEAEMILEIPAPYQFRKLNIDLTINGKEITGVNVIPGKKYLRIPFSLTLPEGNYNARVYINTEPETLRNEFIATTTFIRLKYKINEVKTDRLTGGMIVNKRQFFPFGFYCYSPVTATPS